MVFLAQHKVDTAIALGSIYILLWLAYTNLHVPFVQADGTLASDAANILRCPASGEPISITLSIVHEFNRQYIDSSLGRLVQQTIIPTLRFLSERCVFRFGDLFSEDLLTSLGIAPHRLCNDLHASDGLFSSLPSKYVGVTAHHYY